MSKEDEKDSLGARMKRYEAVTTSGMLIPGLPVYARVDGRHFSHFTKGLGFPYRMIDPAKQGSEMLRAMGFTAQELCREYKCLLVETHSDELSLCWEDPSKAPFDGRLFKLVSNIASMAGVLFYHAIAPIIPDKIMYKQFPSFDCRVFQVPDKMELANLFIWRQNDCIRGSINQLSQIFFSAKQLHGKTCEERLEMLRNAGCPWESQPDALKYGRFYHKVLTEEPMPEKWRNMPGNENKDTIVRSFIEPFEVDRKIADIPSDEKVKYLFGNN